MNNSTIFPDLKGRSVFITGGGSGIGGSITEGFLRQGAKVSFVQRSDASAFVDKMEETTGNRPFYIQCDIKWPVSCSLFHLETGHFIFNVI